MRPRLGVAASSRSDGRRRLPRVPAFYTDVTDSYRLGRGGRLRTDLGGMYFNAITALLVAAVWWLSGDDAWLLVVATQILQMIRQLTPLVGSTDTTFLPISLVCPTCSNGSSPGCSGRCRGTGDGRSRGCSGPGPGWS